MEFIKKDNIKNPEARKTALAALPALEETVRDLKGDHGERGAGNAGGRGLGAGSGLVKLAQPGCGLREHAIRGRA